MCILFIRASVSSATSISTLVFDRLGQKFGHARKKNFFHFLSSIFVGVPFGIGLLKYELLSGIVDMLGSSL